MVRMMCSHLVAVFCVCSPVGMVNRFHVDLVVLERLVELARRRFAMIPAGAGFWRVAHVFRRVMRLRVYMIRSPRIRAQAVDRLMALRRACEFRTRCSQPWGKFGIGFRCDDQMGVESSDFVY